MCGISTCSNFPHTKCHHDLESSSFNLLELAANDDLQGLKQAMEEQDARANECASWYCRQFGSNKMASVERSPIMIAALFGSVKVLRYLLDHLEAHGGDVNSVCGADKVSALHCAMASGTGNMLDVVQLLLTHGADPTLVSLKGLRDADAKLMSQLSQNATTEEASLVTDKASLDKCMNVPLESDAPDWSVNLPDSVSDTSFEDLEESMRNLQDPNSGGSSQNFSSAATWSPKSTGSHASENQDAPPDRAFDVLASDVKSGIYSTDEFRMYSFKVRTCSRAYSHDWTECPFAHPGENARRRDPRRFHYSCVPCPDFRKGACRHGDACEYAHGVFESWLHPAQYRTRQCKDGTNCARKVCFFAHTKEEVRPLYLSTEGGVGTCPSPCASPSSVKPSPFLPGGMNLGQSSPSSVCSSWTQPGLPTLRLPEGISHPSKLRPSLSARDMALVEGQSMRDLISLSAQARINAAVVAASNSSALNSPVRDRKLQSFGLSLSSAANFEDVMYGAVSPRSPLQVGMQSSPRMVSKFHESGVGNAALEELIAAMSSPRHPLSSGGRSMKLGQYDEWGQMQGMASQMGSSSCFSGNMGSSPSAQAEVGFLHRRGMESSACLSPAASREDETWLNWGSPTGKLEWGVSGDDLTRFRKSFSCKA
ncbi:hypothetical protein GOP47_0014191 [Adiantum capillus-veneris]|uniref:C3H1-type domain-containing protein n=1 Tax=Adiantum capillus-veneris TaxID=13818 RepID=A0A9D4UPY3_ADICA|nr:hypothetical protein GOP47_0014191 [Adiantum capillus-veneris]